MQKIAALSCLTVVLALAPSGGAGAQGAAGDSLHVVKSSINAEAENAEFCLEFDHALASLSPAHLANALKLEQDGKKITPQNVEATGTSLCLFPLERNKPYHLEVTGLRGEKDGSGDVKMAAPYSQSFTIQDRSPALSFIESDSDGFTSYDNPLRLRAVNIKHVQLSVYRVADTAAMARAWQDRAQTALAPSESAYLAKSKGQQIWQSDKAFDAAAKAAANATVEQVLSLHDQMPDLAPGLYLMIADAGHKDDSKPASKGLAPLAAAWFVKSDFSLCAIHDESGVHVFASKMKSDIHLIVLNKKQEQIAEAQMDADGSAVIPYPPKLADTGDMATIIGSDAAGNVALADNEALPVLSKPLALGTIRTHDLFAVPGDAVDVTLAAAEGAAHLSDQTVLRLLRGDAAYADFKVPAPNGDSVKLSFPAPAAQGAWKMLWQKNDGAVLADAPLRVTANADAPHLDVTSEHDFLSGDLTMPVTVKALSRSGRPVVLTGGRVLAAWQKFDPAALGWKEYRFGMPDVALDAPVRIANFLTNLQGAAQLHLTLPKPPAEPGLYQAALTMIANADSGIMETKPLILPLRADTTVIGIKPLPADARFHQNGLARFALIGLSSDSKPHDVSGLSYQIYEEGRSFAWYQNEGHWQYRPEPQLRPIGGGALTIKADGSSMLEWPVTAGNYRLEILDANDKKLAQTDFSAGWNAATPVAPPLALTLPKNAQAGHEAIAHVMLPEPAMLTVIIADQHMRKMIHELRGKGDNAISFTPAGDWRDSVTVMVDAAPQEGSGASLRASGEVTLAQTAPDKNDDGVSIIAPSVPAAMILRKGGKATLGFGIENNGDDPETYQYVFGAAPGLKIDSSEKGALAVAGKQSRAFTLSVSADQVGVKDIRLDVISAHQPRISRSWAIAILPKEDSLRSKETMSVAAKDVLLRAHNAADPAVAFVSKRSMDGLAEILAFAFNARPFTTEELALSIDALRLWADVLAQSGFAPDFLVKARRQEWLMRLLRRQNSDGGFASQRGGESDMENTAAALTALGPDMSEQTAPAKALAVGWIRQRLSNTWFDDKERPARAAAFAALAAADAVDIASLHYFSDTSATEALPPLAEAHIAAAFKHIHDPNAAAFWIKKMLDEKGEASTITMLNALAATDALSSDEVHAALAAMAVALRQGKSPDIRDAAGLLRAIAADNVDAGKWRLSLGAETHDISGVAVLRASDAVAAAARNGSGQALSVTYIAPVQSVVPAASVTRHVYRLNGVELSPQTKPARNETYLVELKGNLPATEGTERILLQDGKDSAVRPVGCPLSTRLDALAFLPWLTTRDVTPTTACELTAYGLNAVLMPGEDNDKDSFRALYFAHLDAPSLADIAPAHVRVVK